MRNRVIDRADYAKECCLQMLVVRHLLQSALSNRTTTMQPSTRTLDSHIGWRQDLGLQEPSEPFGSSISSTG